MRLKPRHVRPTWGYSLSCEKKLLSPKVVYAGMTCDMFKFTTPSSTIIRVTFRIHYHGRRTMATTWTDKLTSMNLKTDQWHPTWTLQPRWCNSHCLGLGIFFIPLMLVLYYNWINIILLLPLSFTTHDHNDNDNICQCRQWLNKGQSPRRQIINNMAMCMFYCYYLIYNQRYLFLLLLGSCHSWRQGWWWWPRQGQWQQTNMAMSVFFYFYYLFYHK